MKLLLYLLLFIIIFWTLISIKVCEGNLEGLCGNYSLTYTKVKEVLEEQDVSGIINSYDINYKRDLLTTC